MVIRELNKEHGSYVRSKVAAGSEEATIPPFTGSNEKADFPADCDTLRLSSSTCSVVRLSTPSSLSRTYMPRIPLNWAGSLLLPIGC